MRTVRYAGLRIDSEVSLPALPAWPDVDPCVERVRIVHGEFVPGASQPSWTHVWKDPDGSANLQVARLAPVSPDRSFRYRLRVPQQCDFLLDPQQGVIVVEGGAGVAANTLEHLLIDQALPRLVAARGMTTLHASLVRIGRRCVAFLGRSGWGKSTLASLLHQRGHPALCDDCAVLRIEAEYVSATPSYPGLRLYADSIKHALDGRATSGQVSDYSDKQRVIDIALPAAALGPHPLDAIILLGDPAQQQTSITLEELSPAAACMALIEHSFRIDPTDKAQSAKALRNAGTIARRVPLKLLRYPRDYARQADLVEAILSQVN